MTPRVYWLHNTQDLILHYGTTGHHNNNDDDSVIKLIIVIFYYEEYLQKNT